MAGMRSTAVRWYRKVFGAPAGSDIREQGLDTVLDGNTAVALSEAGIATHAVLGGTAPAGKADSVWLDEVEHGTNLFGDALAAQMAEGPRGIVAAATGLALSGKRATAFLSGTDIAATQDLLISAAGKHAPLVMHVGTRAASAHGAALGSGHESVHLSADSGFFMLFAANVQEAVDFSYIARKVAEETLVPGLVVMDGEQTALAAQDVRLLSPTQVNSFLGAARERIESPTAAQKLLFGDSRRRVPAWHDLDEPALAGALYDKDSFALGAFARVPFFDAFVTESLQGAFAQFARRTGREHAAVSRYRLDDAKTVLLAQGAAIETARAAADQLRKQHKIKAGVLGIHALRPFPGAEIAAALAGRERVFVLERTATALSGEPPLTREVRACLDNGQRRPDCSTAIYGVGGLPLRTVDLVALATRGEGPSAAPLFVGASFDDTSGEQPKRAVLLDALRRAYPGAGALGVMAPHDAVPGKHKGARTIAIRRVAGQGGNGLLETTAAMLHALEEGRVRTRPHVDWNAWSDACVDWLTHGDDDLQDPGDGLVADVALDVAHAMLRTPGDGKAYNVALDDENAETEETLLGALFGVMLETGLLDEAARAVIGARKKLLEGVAPDRREIMVAAFQAGLEQITVGDALADDLADSASRWEGEAPAAVRHLGRDDETFASLPRFWDQTGVLYRDDRTDRLTADPFLATGTMPPLSSTFNDTSPGRARMPAFDPSQCTGCGKCWTNCPDSAIGVVAATPTALLEAGIRKAGADAVRQVSSKLASRIISANKSGDDVATTFGQLVDDAYEWLSGKMPLPEDRKKAIDDGIAAITGAYGKLPVAVTQPFFRDAEAAKKDSAELLSIVINPEACKSCGLCVASCEDDALSGAVQTEASLAGARELWGVFAATPDTASETVERIADNEDVGPMAAILLSRYCQFALAGGDAAEAGSGEKIATRLALASTEFHQQPIAQSFAEQLAEAGEQITALINQTLSGTLAVEDLDAVTERLKRTKSPRVDLKELADSVADTAGDHSVDTEQVLRLIELSNRISAAQHSLTTGPHGLGRARYGLAVAGGTAAEWAGAFPHNPFQAPVLIDMTGDAAQLSAGLVEGHLEETTDLVRLLRQARIEIDQPDGAAWKRDALATLRWQDLDADELALCPPLVLVGSDEMLAGQGLGQLIWLLNSNLPVKVLVLSSLDFGLLESSINNPRGNLGLLALAQRNAFVAQSSVANAAHLGESMLQALRYDGPALIQVYAPSPARHGFMTRDSLAQARLAIASRALPLFRYNPDGDGVFGSRISLDGNPDDVATTLADWALGQRRFASHLKPLADDAATPTALGDWLQLDARGRKGKTPFVAAGEGDEERRFAVSAGLAEASRACVDNWRTLQELAGVVTPFTDRVAEEIREQVAAEHKAELDAQKKASDAEIREMQDRMQAEIASNIRARLLQLATKKRN
jgi:pyruvate-ferredoxin/flavodoxin oxidoreductase